MTRNIYTKEFKIQAVALLEQPGKTVGQVAKELGIKENNLHNWRKQLRIKQEKAFPNETQFDEKELELRRLKSRILELEEEREILKKAAAFFARESQRSTR